MTTRQDFSIQERIARDGQTVYHVVSDAIAFGRRGWSVAWTTDRQRAEARLADLQGGS